MVKVDHIDSVLVERANEKKSHLSSLLAGISRGLNQYIDTAKVNEKLNKDIDEILNEGAVVNKDRTQFINELKNRMIEHGNIIEEFERKRHAADMFRKLVDIIVLIYKYDCSLAVK